MSIEQEEARVNELVARIIIRKQEAQIRYIIEAARVRIGE